MNKIVIVFLFTILFSFCKSEDSKNATKKVLMTPKIYSNLFIRRREEQKLFINHLLKSEYEKIYKMLDLAFAKIIEVIRENNATLNQKQYNLTQGYPENDEKLQDSISLIIENTCLGGEIILHLPEISRRILKKYEKWKLIFNWGIKFILNYNEIIDENTIKMLNLFKQEINENERDKDYINPYYKKNSDQYKRSKFKKKKKLIKKGPQLNTRNEL